MIVRTRRELLLAGLLALAFGCSTPTAPETQDNAVPLTTKRTITKKTSAAVETPKPDEAPPPNTTATQSVTPGGDSEASKTSTVPATPEPNLRVVKADGTPAAGVSIRFYLGSAPATTAYRQRMLQSFVSSLDTSTDANGYVNVDPLPDLFFNIEAAQGDSAKAFAFNVPIIKQKLTLQLQPTGSITGVIRRPGVSDHTGIAVRLAGTPYTTTTVADGTFTLDKLPATTYSLSAVREVKYTYNRAAVTVKASEVTNLGELMLASDTPVITQLTPANGGPGVTVNIAGEQFSASSTYTVTFDGTAATSVQRVNATTLSAVVPPTANSGPVVVSTSGKDSNTLPFQVLNKLELTPTSATMVSGGTRTFTLQARDAGNVQILEPAIAWSKIGAAITVSNSGGVTAVTPGTGTVMVTSGNLSATAPVTVLQGLTVPGLTVSTVAGNGTAGLEDGPSATPPRFTTPTGVAIDPEDPNENVYVVDNADNRIRVILSDQVTTAAGSTASGTMDSTGIAARFTFPTRIRHNPGETTFLVIDSGNHAIREFDRTNNQVTTIAGGGGAVPVGSFLDGVGLAARFNFPGGAAKAPSGDIFVADTDNHCIRRIAAGTRAVTVFAGSGTAPSGNANGQGTAARFANPSDVVVAEDGNIYVSDTGNSLIRRITPSGNVSTLSAINMALVAGGTFTDLTFSEPAGLAVDGNWLYVCDQHGISIIDISSQPYRGRRLCGGPASGFQDGTNPAFNAPISVTVDGAGNLYVADRGNIRIRKITFTD